MFTLVDDNIEPISVYRANSPLEKASWMKAMDMMFAARYAAPKPKPQPQSQQPATPAPAARA